MFGRAARRLRVNSGRSRIARNDQIQNGTIDSFPKPMKVLIMYQSVTIVSRELIAIYNPSRVPVALAALHTP